MTFYPVSVKMAHVRVGYLLFAVGAVLAQDTTINRNKQLDPKYRPYWPLPDTDWNAVAQNELKRALNYEKNDNIAKNVILFIGDGMGIPTVTAARIYKGQKMGNPGEETKLAWETFPNLGLIKTYNHNHQVPDSAGTATQYLCGEKVNFGTIGVNNKVLRGNCSSQAGNELYSILKWTTKEGKSAGVVSTTRLTHASPAASYGHVAERYWESDANQNPAQRALCPDLAKQMIEDNQDIQVFLGGGRKSFLPEDVQDPEYPDKNGTRVDKRNLFQEWLDSMQRKNNKAKYVWNKDQFDAVDPKETDYLIGSFEPNNMNYEHNRPKDKAGEPHIKEMTRKAIEILQKNKKGFFLFVEGGRIDHAHHDSLAHLALKETLAMEEAVMEALKMTDPRETLIVVTADHSHAFNAVGYPSRGNDILGFVDEVAYDIEPARDDKPYLSLHYGNGPGGAINKPRKDLTGMTKEQLHDVKFAQPSLVNTKYTTHGGEDVGVYAYGAMSYLFHTTHEQNYIAHAMAYASCVGQNKSNCERQRRGENCKPCRCPKRKFFLRGVGK